MWIYNNYGFMTYPLPTPQHQTAKGAKFVAAPNGHASALPREGADKNPMR